MRTRAILAAGTLAALGGLAAVAARPSASSADTTPPQTRISRGPGQTLWVPSARFRFAADEPVLRFACSLDGGEWRRCRSGVVFRGLEVGDHVLRVRAVDVAGNRDRSPAVREWRYQPRVG